VRAAMLLPAWIGWFMFGGMGLWVAAVGAAALKSGKTPKILTYFPFFCVFRACSFFSPVCPLQPFSRHLKKRQL
jgi:hypothetical protein